MWVDVLPIVLMAFGSASSSLPVAKVSPHARYWLAADDAFLRPGEGTYVWMWIEYLPGAGAPVLFQQYPAKVLWHAFSDASILCDRPWPDTYSAGIVGVTSYYQGQLLEYQGTPFKDGIFGIHFINALPNSGKPGYAKSPLAIYQFYFKPKIY